MASSTIAGCRQLPWPALQVAAHSGEARCSGVAVTAGWVCCCWWLHGAGAAGSNGGGHGVQGDAGGGSLAEVASESAGPAAPCVVQAASQCERWPGTSRAEAAGARARGGRSYVPARPSRKLTAAGRQAVRARAVRPEQGLWQALPPQV
eukprot:CAMPEP_0179164596 /NCGR_PEP_ID=MMETSP0796-20121207/80795_1 /TAXON_ID=73915 /ORGANISM="Pyrodinium bahamense, Strain pbaha01" /LENGTH=148 /DNA_ID=CAMNT_0020867079 /DNA_START=103 /DNA_END=549 /DNA_ORIENTATION=-